MSMSHACGLGALNSRLQRSGAHAISTARESRISVCHWRGGSGRLRLPSPRGSKGHAPSSSCDAAFLEWRTSTSTRQPLKLRLSSRSCRDTKQDRRDKQEARALQLRVRWLALYLARTLSFPVSVPCTNHVLSPSFMAKRPENLVPNYHALQASKNDRHVQAVIHAI